MLEHVLEFAVKVIGHAFGKMAESAPPPRPPRPDASRVDATAKAYRRWAAQQRFVHDEATGAYGGTMSRHPVLVSPGLQGSAPIGVEVEVTIDAPADEQGAIASVLLRPSDEGARSVEKALCALFRDPDLSDALRSIALTASLLRLRFVALTAPRVVERTIAAAVDAIEYASRPQALRPTVERVQTL